jgi:hypothetical protein
MKGNLGSEVRLGAKTLSEDTFGTTNSLRAPAYAWSAKRYRHAALRCSRAWRITKGRQGCHHLPPTPQLWNTRQMKVMCSFDTTSTLTVTTLALAWNFRLYQESSTRALIPRMNDDPASK